MWNRLGPVIVVLAAVWILRTHGVASAQTPCVGDCNGDGDVTIDELITGVGIALGTTPVSACPAVDCLHPGVGIACLVAAVGNSLIGCISTDTLTPAPTRETPTPTDTAIATCTATRTFVPLPTLTASATGTATRTCASAPSPPSCPVGEGAACEDQQCLIGCGCGTVTPTATVTNTCTPGANPKPGCGYEGPTFTITPVCHIPTSTPSLVQPTPTVDIIVYCGERENVGGCCDFGGQRPCYPLVAGSDSAMCFHTDGGYPHGCTDFPVVCNVSTGLCEESSPTPLPVTPTPSATPTPQTVYELTGESRLRFGDTEETATGRLFVTACFSPNTYFAYRIDSVAIMSDSIAITSRGTGLLEAVTLYPDENAVTFGAAIVVNGQDDALYGSGPIDDQHSGQTLNLELQSTSFTLHLEAVRNGPPFRRFDRCPFR